MKNEVRNGFLFLVFVSFVSPLAQAQPITVPGEILKCQVMVAPVWADGAPHAFWKQVPELGAQTRVLPMEGDKNRVTALDASKLGITYHVELQAVDGFSSSTLTLDRTSHSIYGTASIEDLRSQRGTTLYITSRGSAVSFLYDGGTILAAELTCSATR